MKNTKKNTRKTVPFHEDEPARARAEPKQSLRLANQSLRLANRSVRLVRRTSMRLTLPAATRLQLPAEEPPARTRRQNSTFGVCERG